MIGPFPLGELVGGRYRVEGQLGQGGMGVVYRATEVQTGAGVALKVVTGFGSPEHVVRFEREARLAARAEIGEGVVRVFDLGQHRGLPYVAMELVEGQDMSDALVEGMEPQRLARIVEAVARTLEGCHRAGVVHRDLKPGNVLLRADDDTPRVADFGLARDLRGDEQQLTKTGQLLGTPAFMAPEQVDEAMSVGPSADIYALGAILYNGLAGQKPWQGPLPQVIRNLLLKDPPRPSTLRDGVPADLEAICRVAMAKEPQDRYASAELLAEDLARFLRGEDVLARPLSRAKSYWRRARRGDRAVRVAMAGALLLLLSPVLIGVPSFMKSALDAAGEGEKYWKGHEGWLELAPFRELDAAEVTRLRAEGADLREWLERTRWGLWDSERGADALNKVAAMQLWLAHCEGGEIEPGPSAGGAHGLRVEALISIDRQQDRRARRRIKAYVEAGGKPDVARRLELYLDLRGLEGEPERLLERLCQTSLYPGDYDVARHFAHQPLRQWLVETLRPPQLARGGWVLPTGLTSGSQVPDMAQSVGLLSEDGPPELRQLKLEALAAGAQAWQEVATACQYSSSELMRELLDHIGTLLESRPKVLREECPDLSAALKAALADGIGARVQERGSSLGSSDRSSAAIVELGRRLQRWHPEDKDLPQAFEEFLLELLLFSRGGGAEELEEVAAAVSCLDMRVVPSGDSLVRRLSNNPQALKRLEEQEHSTQRSILFLRAMLAATRLPKRPAATHGRELDEVAESVVTVLWGLPGESAQLEALVEAGLLPPPQTTAGLDSDLARHYRGEAWLTLFDLLGRGWRGAGVVPSREHVALVEPCARRAQELLGAPEPLCRAYGAQASLLKALAGSSGDVADWREAVAVWEEAVRVFRERVAAPREEASNAFTADWNRSAFQEEAALIDCLEELALALASLAQAGGTDADASWRRAIEAMDEAIAVGRSFVSFKPEDSYKLAAEKAWLCRSSKRLDEGEAALALVMPDGLADGAFAEEAVRLAMARGDLDEARRRCAIALEHNPKHEKLLGIQDQLRDP